MGSFSKNMKSSSCDILIEYVLTGDGSSCLGDELLAAINQADCVPGNGLHTKWRAFWGGFSLRQKPWARFCCVARTAVRSRNGWLASEDRVHVSGSRRWQKDLLVASLKLAQLSRWENANLIDLWRVVWWCRIIIRVAHLQDVFWRNCAVLLYSLEFYNRWQNEMPSKMLVMLAVVCM